MSHIAKRLLSCELYKSWVSLISQGVEDKDEKRQGGFSFLVSARSRKPRRRKENPMTTYEIDREHGLDIFYSWKMMIELKPQVIIIN